MKNKIIKAVMITCIIVFLISACLVDSDSYIPIITAFVSEIMILIFIIANRERWERDDF